METKPRKFRACGPYYSQARELAVGSSFTVPAKDRARVRRQVTMWTARLAPQRFTSRTVEGALVVERVS